MPGFLLSYFKYLFLNFSNSIASLPKYSLNLSDNSFFASFTIVYPLSKQIISISEFGY